MGGNTIGNWKTVSASLFATALIIAAFVMARDGGSPTTVQASAETELLAQIAARDVDGDGLPDWEEILYGTDPKVVDTFKLGMTDGEAVRKGLVVPKAEANIATASSSPNTFTNDPSVPIPADGTITKMLSQNLISAYFAALKQSPNGRLTDAEVKKISSQIITQLNNVVVEAPDFKKMRDLRVTGSSAEDLRTFAISAEAVLKAHTARVGKSEVDYLKSAIDDGDETAYAHLLEISKLYQKAATGLSALPVPGDLADTELKLINTFSRLSKIVADFTRADSDPIVTMLAIRQYPSAIQTLGTSFVDISVAYKLAGITFKPGEPGAEFVNLIEDLLVEQKAQAKVKP